MLLPMLRVRIIPQPPKHQVNCLISKRRVRKVVEALWRAVDQHMLTLDLGEGRFETSESRDQQLGSSFSDVKVPMERGDDHSGGAADAA